MTERFVMPLRWPRGARVKHLSSVLLACGLPAAVIDQAIPDLPAVPARLTQTIPGDGPGYTLARVSGVATLSEGLTAVLSAGEQTIRVFDATGRLVRSIGRNGAGPGEFRMPRMLGRVGDSLWTWDIALSRITVFREDGRLVRTVLVPIRGDAILLTTGQVGVFTARTYGTALRHDNSLTVRRLDKGDTVTIFRAPVPYRELKVSLGGQSVVGRQPFDDDALLAMSLDGTGFALVNRASGGEARESVFRVLRVGARGDTLFARRIPYRPRPLSSKDIEAAVEQLVGPLPKTVQSAARADVRSALYRPRTLPPVTAAFLARDGTLWLRRELVAGEGTCRWLVLDAHGAPTRQVEIDRSFFPYEISGSTLWGTMVGADGIESLVKLTVGA